jgi:hypothetical protein
VKTLKLNQVQINNINLVTRQDKDKLEDWNTVFQFVAIQKSEDQDIWNYNFARCPVWM